MVPTCESFDKSFFWRPQGAHAVSSQYSPMDSDKPRRIVSAELLSGNSWEELLTFLAKGEKDKGAIYEQMRERLFKFFRYKGSLEPEELTDATLNRVARLLAAGQQLRTDDPTKYVLGVGRLIHLETVKREVRSKKSLDDTRPKTSVHDANEREQHAATLEFCLAALSAEDREVILVYHEGQGQARIDRRKDLATKLDMPLNALRIRAFRIRGRLEECMRGRTPDQ